ncbi:hypothetical protein AMJ83_01920 [candidate division WOR_3 bacterium SM23_42]|uniref:CHAT domain-containing protein n=1 Tax=candidate division WOR_3 bacterium SM23_42 TaxID=1703779 RepID=A0A0S8FX48_UNCW3|nr:MAG: hypothetical protein AMJ83_01920 [candidate division WOR_3 bacterium SM23_42]
MISRVSTIYFVVLFLCSNIYADTEQPTAIVLAQRADSLYYEAEHRFDTYDYQAAISIFRQALMAEVVLGRKDQISHRLHNIGEVFYELCECDSALVYFDSALVLARKAENRKSECRIINAIGEVYEVLSQYDRALTCYDSALVISRRIDDKYTEGRVLCNIGWAYDALSDYEKALAYQDSALVIVHLIGEKNLEGKIHRRIGTAYSVLGRYDKAFAYYDSALVIARATKDLKLEGRTLMGIGWVNNALRRYDKSLDFNRAALDIMWSIKDRMSAAYVLDCSGMTYRFLCQYDSALAYHNAALEIRRELKDQLGEGNTLVNLGLTYDDYYRYDKALAYLDSALTIAKAIKNRSQVIIIFISIGAICDQLARYDQALAHYDSALAISRDTRERLREGSILMYIGGIYHGLEQYDRALSYYDSARVIIKELNIEYTNGLILIYVGAASRALKRYDEALSVYDSALVIMRAIKERRMEGVTLHNMGCTYYNLGQYDKALAYFDSALVIADEVINKFRKTKILSHIGAVFREREQYDRALAYYDSALVLARQIRDQNTEGTTLHDIGYLYEQELDVEKAIFYYKQSIEVKESIRETFERVDLKTYYIESEKDVYERLIILLIMLGQYEEAFDYMERSRSQKLRKAFEQGEMVAYDPSLQRMLERINFLSSEMEGLRKRYQRNKIEESEYLASLSALEGQFNQKMLDLKVYHPQLYNIMVPQHRMLKYIQEIIPDSVVFLEFVSVGNTYVVLLFTKDIFLAQSRVQPKDSIDQWVMQALTSLKWQAAEDELDKLYARLYDVLIAPSEPQITGFPNVVIIPYGILHYLPFHALRRRDAQEHLQYFVEWKRISYLPSASFLTDLLLGVEYGGQTLLAFGNADGTLPSAEIEVDLIAQIFPECCVCKYDSARKDRFIEVCGDYRLIHLATHGILDADPRFSHIVLAPPREGNLTVREILGLSGHFKRTSLVTLSACETAVEADPGTAGMELVTLSNAFKVAGVPTIVASLWEIADRSTALLMESFYKNLKSGKMDKLEALRQAQVAMIQHDGYAHPYYWAPFILIGGWR